MKNFALTIAFLTSMTTAGLCQAKSFIDQPYVEVDGYADSLESKVVSAFKSMGIKTDVDLTTGDMASNYKFYLLKQKDVLKSKEYLLKVSDAQTATQVFQ